MRRSTVAAAAAAVLRRQPGDRHRVREPVDLRPGCRHGSYTVARAHLDDGFLPDPASVRTEEFVNYFDQD